MEKGDPTEILQRDTTTSGLLCSEKERLVKKMVRRILSCEDPAERRVISNLLSSLLTKVELCSSYEEKASCLQCRQLNVFRKRALDLSTHYDLKLTRINGRIDKSIARMGSQPTDLLPDIELVN